MKQFLSEQAIIDLNYRINQEEYSSRLYHEIALWFEVKGYSNFSKLYSKYSGEEMSHAQWAKDFLLSFDIKPELQIIKTPDIELECCMDALGATITHEEEITRQCQELAINAIKRGEIMLHDLALKYCREQVEELEKSYTVKDIAMLTTDMLILDKYIGDKYL